MLLNTMFVCSTVIMLKGIAPLLYLLNQLTKALMDRDQRAGILLACVPTLSPDFGAI